MPNHQAEPQLKAITTAWVCACSSGMASLAAPATLNTSQVSSPPVVNPIVATRQSVSW